MRRHLFGLSLGLVIGLLAVSARAATFSDIQFWAGSGSKQAALVIDFNDGKTNESLLWGYRWDGTATGEDMLRAVIAADANLYANFSGPTQYGTNVFGLGYDTTGGNDFAVTPALAFTQRVHVSPTFTGNDGITPVNPLDHYTGGWYDGYWSYWGRPDATTAWTYPGAGMTDRVLSSGAWDGWSFANLAVTYGDAPGEPAAAVPEPTALCGLLLAGLAGLRRRRRAVACAALAGTASAASAAYVYDPNDFAVEVVASTNMPASTLYNDASALLGRPTLQFNSGNLAIPDNRRAKLIESVFNTSPAGGKLIASFGSGQSVTVRMGRAVTNDPSHPFGIDLNVFGNAFFTPNNSGGTTGDDTNLNSTTLGGIFAENVRVSVSPDNVSWYTFGGGASGDGYFPTNAYRWDRAAAIWTNDELDPTKAVDPQYRDALTGLTAADALDRYAGAAGGAGFDIGPSGFASINYVRFDGLADFNGGEVDAVAAVTPEPGTLGVVGVTLLLLGRKR